MMKRIVATLFFLSLTLAAAALVAPSMIDWSQHKEALLGQLRPYLQRDIQVAGDVKFRLIPSPQILLDDVTIANAEGGKAPSFMKLKQLEARISLQPLLQGRFEVETINLSDPEVNLEILPGGKPNWSDILKQKEEDDSGDFQARADSVQLNQVTMTNGTVHYTNADTGSSWQVESLNLAVGADTLFGPYRIKGDMQYNKSSVGIEATTGKYEKGTPVPVNIGFTPVEGLPVVKFGGVADFAEGFALQGELNIDQGKLASLFPDNDFLQNISFMNDIATLTGMLDVKGPTVKLGDIKATLDKKGEFSGVVSVQFAQGEKPDVSAELTAANLKIGEHVDFMAVPDGFTAHLKFKGKNISWGDVNIPSGDISIDTDKAEWVLKDTHIDLPGKTKIKLAGVITPKTKYAAYSMQVSTDELSKMVAALGLDADNIIRAVGDSGIVHKLEWSSSMDVKPEQISLFDISAKANDKAAISGVLNVLRGKAQGFTAHLTLTDVDFGALDADSRKTFGDKLLKSPATLELSGKNITDGDLVIADVEFKGKVDPSGLLIEKMEGALSPSGSFTLTGKLAGLEPVSGADLSYSIKAGQLGAVAKSFGVEIPPPLWGSQDADLQGTLKGDAKAFSFTALGKVQGSDINLSGAGTRREKDAVNYKNDISIKGAKWSQIGLAADHLFSDAPFDFSGSLSGTRSNYKIDNMKAGNVTGSLSRAEGAYTGNLASDVIDLDGWFGNWSVTDPVDLKLKGKTLNWRSNDISAPELHIVASAKHAAVTKGTLWGGDLTAKASGDKVDDKHWNGSLTGKLKGADLQNFADNMEFKGFTLGQGDMSFDLTADGTKEDKEWFHGTSGSLDISADSVKIEDFNPAALPELINGVTGAPSPDFGAQAAKAVKTHGGSRYKNVEGKFKVADGKITIDSLKLANDVADVDATGFFDLGPEKYSLLAKTQLHDPAGVPAFTVSRAGEMKSSPEYTVNSRPIESWLAARAPKEEVPPAGVTPPGHIPADEPLDAPPPPASEHLPYAASPQPPVPLVPQADPAQSAPVDNPYAQEEPGLPPSYTKSPDDTRSEPAPKDPDQPVDAEPLKEPQIVPQPLPKPADDQSATPPAPGAKDIKGILDRLDDNAPANDNAPAPAGKPAEEDVLP